MSNQTLDQDIVARYTGQPTRLPPELRRKIEAAWDGAPVLLYALADLGPTFELAESWVALGQDHVAIARALEDRSEFELTVFPRRLLRAVRETPGLSATTLSFESASGRRAARRGALHQPAAARLREPPLRARGRHRPARGEPARPGLGVRRVGGPPGPRRPGDRGRTAHRRDLAAAVVPEAVPARADAGHVGRDADHPGEPGAPMAHGLRARQTRSAGQSGHAAGKQGGDAGVAHGLRHGGDLPAPPGRRGGPAPADGDHGRVGRPRPAHRAVRALADAQPLVLLAQEDREPHHPGVTRTPTASGTSSPSAWSTSPSRR